ncbi:MAG: carbon starvation protein A [Candidatus Omnitrophota bacterium]
MNSLIVATIVLILFWLGYKFYGGRLQRIYHINPQNPTPAVSKFDGIDYVPAKHWLVLFGHHFSSIAGAGPIIGPVIAVMLWGWFPAILWVVLGTILIGGVHDFSSLVISIREGGSSIADIAGGVISRHAKIIFSLFVWLALILVIAVFAYLCADTFVKEPKIVLPSLGLIPVAMVVGYLLYIARVNIVLATVLGLVSLAGLILLGNSFPINGSINIWILVLFIYCYAASILPVNILLQPRDYLSSFLLFFGVGAGYIGLLFSHPKLSMPYYNNWRSSEGSLWPMLFITVACGAISGFHALIASGTSSKQIANERYAKRIGYGGMVAEGVIAALAIISAAILFTRGEDFGAILKNLTPIGIFAKGYGLITKNILAGSGQIIAIIILNAFILTTLDSATRISRYLTEELLRIKNRYLSTLIIVTLGAVLAFSGKWNKIWPAFGASNQLVAALALLVATCWLLAHKKPYMYTLLPAIFMLVTTLVALALQAQAYFKNKDFVLLSIAIILTGLAMYMLFESAKAIKRHKKCVN